MVFYLQSFCVRMSKIVVIYKFIQLSYKKQNKEVRPDNILKISKEFFKIILTYANASVEMRIQIIKFFKEDCYKQTLQKGVVPAAPSGTATLLRLSPNYQFRPRPILAVTDFRRPRLSWLDGRCVQGPGTYSPRHG